MAAVGGDDADALGAVDDAAAADGDDDIATFVTVALRAGHDFVVLRIRCDGGEHDGLDARFVQVFRQLVEPAGGGDARIGDHEGAASLHVLRVEGGTVARPIPKMNSGATNFRIS